MMNNLAVRNKDFLVLVGMFFLALSLPLATNLVKQSQDDRSRAEESTSSQISFKIAFKGVKSSYRCLNSLNKVKLEIANVTTNTYQSDLVTNITPVSNETNTTGDQVYLISHLVLDSKFNHVNNFNYLRVKGPNHLTSRLCLNNQTKKLDEITTCDINLSNTNTTIYNFSNYSLLPGDINQDGLVNGIDYSIIKNNVKADANPTCGQPADLNYDGIVNSLDANLLKESLSTVEDGQIIINPTQIPTTLPTTNPTTIVNPSSIPTKVPTSPWDKETYDPIKPSKITYGDESDTLKVYIVKNDGYYITYIWAKDPYKQLKKYTTDEYGQTYDAIDNILDKAVAKAGIKNKIAVGFNNDIHVAYNAYYNNSTYWKKYTGTGIILSNGKLYRNDPESPSRRMKVAGIDNTNTLRLYNESKNPLKNNSQAVIDKRKILYQTIIDTGVQNTISNFGYLVNGGQIDQEVYEKSDHAERQTICQVNKNNFIQITTTKGFTNANVAKIAKNLGCSVALHMDGGGSTALYFKNQSTSGWTKKLNVTTRGKMWSILYWTEL